MLVTQSQVEDRIGATTLTRLFDENNDAEADIDPVDGLIRDGSSKVLGILGPVYDVDLLAANPVQLAELVRLTLDVCQAYAAIRYPEFMRGIDGYKMIAQADKDLMKLREGIAGLGVKGPPEPAANQGARITSGNPDAPSTFIPRFSDNWGGRGGF